MPALAIYTDPLKPGIAQVPVFAVGDSTSWTMTFNNGSANYDPGSVSVVLGNIGGLEEISYPSAFRFVDRMNNQSVGSFSITSAVPGSLTWTEAPFYIEGGSGAWMIRGRRPPGGIIRNAYLLATQAVASASTTLRADGGGGTMSDGSVTVTDLSQVVVSATVTNPGSTYTTAPNVTFSGGGGGTGAAATAIINGQGFVTAIIITAGGSGYASTPTITLDAPSGGGTTATGTVSRGAASTPTAVSPGSTSAAFSTLPVAVIEDGGGNPLALSAGLVEFSGVEHNQTCFVRDPITQEVLTGVQCIPIWNGRLNSSGSEVYDDALLVIRPRILLEPTFNASGSGASTVYSGTMDPVTTWVKAVLRYRRSCTVDLQVFGAGRLLFLGKLTVVNDAQ